MIFSDLARRGLSHEDIAAGFHSRALRRLRTGVYAVDDLRDVEVGAGNGGPSGRSPEPADDPVPGHEARRRDFVERTRAAARGRTGAGRARALPPLVHGLSESVLESLIWLIVEFPDLPAPELLVSLHARGGEPSRVDFYWRAWRLVGDADGLAKYGDDSGTVNRTLRREKRRQRELEDAGYRVLRWTWDDLSRPGAVIARIRTEMRRQERLGIGPSA